MVVCEDNIVEVIRSRIQPEQEIPKPATEGAHVVKGWGRRRGEPALIYRMPNHKNPQRPHEKGITESEWRRAWGQLCASGEFSREWFKKNLPRCDEEGGCSFTTIGGVFLLLQAATYERGRYRLSRQL